jgi:hypothetical protein
VSPSPHLLAAISTRTHLKGTKLKARKINQYGRKSSRTTGFGGNGLADRQRLSVLWKRLTINRIFYYLHRAYGHFSSLR